MPKKPITIEERESKTLEFKEKLPPFATLIKTCVAFANGVGGKIMIGVNDLSKEVVGITDQQRDRLYDAFPNSLYDAVSPTLVPRIWERSYDDVSAIMIEIPPSPIKPYFIKSEGMPKGVYVRVGSSTRRASEEHIQDLVREGTRRSYDEESLPLPTETLSPALLNVYYGRSVEERRLIADKLIARQPGNQEQLNPTVAALLFFSEEPHLYIHEATILCTRFKGTEGRDILQTEELTGPIDQLANQALTLTAAWLERDFQLVGVQLKGHSLIPKEALREAIVNALIHKKYTIPAPIKIAVYDDHCEIFNPGNFPGVIDLKHLGDGTTFMRNPVIGRIAHRMRLVEKLGSGIRLIFESCQKAGLPPPKFTEGGDFVKVRFDFLKLGEHTSPEANLIALMRRRGEIAVKELSAELKISRNTATRHLRKLMEQGLVIRSGRGPSTRYRLA